MFALSLRLGGRRLLVGCGSGLWARRVLVRGQRSGGWSRAILRRAIGLGGLLVDESAVLSEVLVPNAIHSAPSGVFRFPSASHGGRLDVWWL